MYKIILLFMLVLTVSCNGQHKTNLPEANPYEQQYNNMVGKWAIIDGSGTLEFFMNGQYQFKENEKEESGNWRINSVQNISLGDVEYKFYFNRNNLVLEDKKGNSKEYKNTNQPAASSDEALSQFVRRIFQDKNGNLWFGTNGDGVIRYDGDALKYFSIDEGFGGVAVRGIVGDKAGNVWFGTEGGLTKYDGKSFTNFTEKDGLVNNDVWSLTIDSKGVIWIGTLQGVSRFNGKAFTFFDLPETESDPNRGVTSTRIVHSIMEDSKGRMWFGNNGGAYIHDGKSLSSISTKDGLPDNSVNDVLEDKNGNIWFATHYKGVWRWDGTSFTQIATKQRDSGTEVWSLYEDKSGNIWFPVENFGVYRYDISTDELTNFHEKEGLASGAIQCAFEDKDGRLWLGGYMGLFRYDGKSVFQVTKKGPWQ